LVRKKEAKKKIYREKRRDEESLYYILERDLDREALFPSHDGWYSQVPFGRGKRIDYIVKYADKVYGIEVKKDFPRDTHFEQAERYLNALNGVFLAYPSDWVGQAVYVSETKESKFPDVGLISLTLYRSHIIRKANLRERQSDQIWKNQSLDDKEYLIQARKEWTLDQGDRLSKTVLEDGCFWVVLDRFYKKHEELSALSFLKSDWKGLGLLYGASLGTSIHRYFSLDDLWKNYCEDLGWKSFNLEKIEMGGLANVRTYGGLLWMWTLSGSSIFFLNKVRRALREHLGKKEYDRLNQKINEWGKQHREKQNIYESEFARLS
jgi:hypothetical protein